LRKRNTTSGGIDVLFGPQFDDLIHSLWAFAADD